MITDNAPVILKYVSVPREMAQLNCGAFLAGIVDACLVRAGFLSRVTAHSTGTDEYPTRTTILIKLDQEVVQRESELS